MIIFLCLAWAAWVLFVNGQQFDGYEMPYDDLGLSDACFDAVNTTVSSCPAWVAGYTGVEDSSFDIVPSEQLRVLCESTCRSDLASLRQAIQTACTEATDVMVPGGSIAYPATFMTDRYLYSTSLSCLTDPRWLGCSNLASWRGWYLCVSSPTGTAIVSEGSSTTTAVAEPTDAQSLSNANCAKWHEVLSGEDCSTISLKYAISLNTSYCVEAVGNIATYTGYVTSTAAYIFTKPAPTTYTPTPAATATPEPTASVYNNAFSSTIADAAAVDSCDIWASIADVTVDDLLSWNPSLSASDCAFMPGVQPSDCNCYIQLRAADKSAFNCTMFWSLFNVSVATVTSLNPWIGSDCDVGVWNVLSSDGFEQICVERNSSAVPTSKTSTILASTSTISTTATPPAEVMPDEASTCNKWHTVVSGDGCQAIADQNDILLSDFYKWNPSVGTSCSSLWLVCAICVGVSF
ncbi:hypothetical protein N7537_006271 [Penicillium hordei]|uniref:LysM domain-containing protein n=1 Tax=Penicillium hordei TaxID=40994 RepID=A0AAD6E772_9EURO|nr:uncharacterized protein N7537_006271 [Penicillium hordei]KAJ5603315.1 hypothetical protein N7537_006271 [Penicillium hordei]